MTKKDEAVFDKAFKKMEAKGYFSELQAKTKTKPQTKSKTKPALKITKKTNHGAGSVSNTRVALKVPLAAQKR